MEICSTLYFFQEEKKLKLILSTTNNIYISIYMYLPMFTDVCKLYIYTYKILLEIIF